MSKASEKLEEDIRDIAQNGNLNNIDIGSLDQELVNKFGLTNNLTIVESEKIGNNNHNNKTDVLLKLSNGKKIKISIKLSNADYFGNWYAHTRALQEFSLDKIKKLISETTKWANEWIDNDHASLFVGVSISFGKRTGETQKNFLDIFDEDDVEKIIKGANSDELDETANVLYIDDKAPQNISELFQKLKIINKTNIRKQIEEFKIIFRPVNPMTSESDRGKNIYTKFVVKNKPDTVKIIDSPNKLKEYGEFEIIDLNVEHSLNHNKVIDDLFDKSNILIPRKNYYNYYFEDDNLNSVYVVADQKFICDALKKDSPKARQIINEAFKSIRKRNFDTSET